MFETLAENLESMIFENVYMVLAGPGIKNRSLFGSFFGHVCEPHFVMLLGSDFCDFWLPLGSQWEHLLGPNSILWGTFFEVIFGADSAAIFGGAGGRGGACLNLQIVA